MDNLITDLKTCDGQKLIDAYEMGHDYIIFDHIDRLSFLIYKEKVKFDYDIFYKGEL